MKFGKRSSLFWAHRDKGKRFYTNWLQTGNGHDQYKVKDESGGVDFQTRGIASSGNLPQEALDDIPGLVSNFLDESEVFSPEAATGT